MKSTTLLALSIAAGMLGGCGGNSATGSNGFSSNGVDSLGNSLGSGSRKGDPARRQPDLGPVAGMNGLRIFDERDVWNQPVDKLPVDAETTKLLAAAGEAKLRVGFGAKGSDGKPFGTPYVVVAGDATRVPITLTGKGADASGYPVPLDTPLDPEFKRAIVIDRDAMKLYEVTGAEPEVGGFKAASAAVWDLRVTSSAVNELPVFPGLARFDEASDVREIKHALRITAPRVGEKPSLPIGTRLRLKKSVAEAKLPAETLAIVRAMKKYGVVVGAVGADWTLTGTSDAKWNDANLAQLGKIGVQEFEAVRMPVPAKSSKKLPEKANALLGGISTP